MPLLTGCTPKEKSEKEILEDLQAEDSLYQEYGLKIDSSEITKRQTNPDSKTDYVWIRVSASNSDFIYNADYKLEYRLYNDGWLLDDYWRDDYNYKPLSYPTDEDALAEIKANYSDAKYEGKYDGCSYIVSGSDQGMDNITYFVECTMVDGYLNVLYLEQANYNIARIWGGAVIYPSLFQIIVSILSGNGSIKKATRTFMSIFWHLIWKMRPSHSNTTSLVG